MPWTEEPGPWGPKRVRYDWALATKQPPPPLGQTVPGGVWPTSYGQTWWHLSCFFEISRFWPWYKKPGTFLEPPWSVGGELRPHALNFDQKWVLGAILPFKSLDLLSREVVVYTDSQMTVPRTQASSWHQVVTSSIPALVLPTSSPHLFTYPFSMRLYPLIKNLPQAAFWRTQSKAALKRLKLFGIQCVYI